MCKKRSFTTAAISTLLVAITGCMPVEEPPVSDSQISLVSRRASQDGRILEFYRNEAYTCGKEGHYTFYMMYDADVPAADSRPLWVRMHGGGSGAFDSNQEYVSSVEEETLVEEDNQLVAAIQEPGLMADVLAAPEGFRVLAPSMCDHDMYSGVGTSDPNNPHNPDENGGTRAVDGLLATRAALDFARQEFRTSHTFVHGTSAGAVGGHSLVVALGQDGEAIDGAILDSGIPDFDPLQFSGCSESLTEAFVASVLNRIGSYVTDDTLRPPASLRDIVTTPIYQVWSRADISMCGDQDISYQSPSSGLAPVDNVISGPAAELVQQPMVDAIDLYNPGGNSVWRAICVDDPLFDGDCDQHSPTRFSASVNGGDLDRDGEDYNEVILNWARQIMDGQ